MSSMTWTAQRLQQRAAAHDPRTRRIITAAIPPPAVAHSSSDSSAPIVVAAAVGQRAEMTIHDESATEMMWRYWSRNTISDHSEILTRTLAAELSSAGTAKMMAFYTPISRPRRRSEQDSTKRKTEFQQIIAKLHKKHPKLNSQQINPYKNPNNIPLTSMM